MVRYSIADMAAFVGGGAFTSAMTEPTSTTTDSTTSEGCCPICGRSVADSPYPRHRLVLEDESDIEPNQHHERRVCPTCWDDLRETLASSE